MGLLHLQQPIIYDRQLEIQEVNLILVGWNYCTDYIPSKVAGYFQNSQDYKASWFKVNPH